MLEAFGNARRDRALASPRPPASPARVARNASRMIENSESYSIHSSPQTSARPVPRSWATRAVCVGSNSAMTVSTGAGVGARPSSLTISTSRPP
jgi:hypothetical protein